MVAMRVLEARALCVRVRVSPLAPKLEIVDPAQC